jgi:hypothetical protein
MNARTHRTSMIGLVVMHLLAVGACLSLAVPPAFALDPGPGPAKDTEATPGTTGAQQLGATSGALAGGAPGMTIYIDPSTGALLREPAPGSVPLQLTPRLQNAFSTSHQGLSEVPISVPGGGVKVDLQGRFRSPLIATTDASGKVRLQHLRETPGIDSNK